MKKQDKFKILDKKLFIKIGGQCSKDVNIRLNTGEDLGYIQTLQINGKVGEFNTCKLESILTMGEIEILEKNTEIKVIIPREYYIFKWLYDLAKILKIR